MAHITLANVYSDVRFRTGLDSTSLGDTDLLRIANKYFKIIVRALVELGEDLYAEIGTFDLVANQQEYTSPADSTSTPWGGGAIKILRMEISYDGTNYYVADPIVMGEIPLSTESVASVNEQFETTHPTYAYFDRNIWLQPVPTSSVTDGGRYFYIKRPAEMTADTAVPELPSDFLDILSLGMSIDVYENLGNDKQMTTALNRFNARIIEMKAQEANNTVEDNPRFVPTGTNYK